MEYHGSRQSVIAVVRHGMQGRLKYPKALNGWMKLGEQFYRSAFKLLSFR